MFECVRDGMCDLTHVCVSEVNQVQRNWANEAEAQVQRKQKLGWSPKAQDRLKVKTGF